MSKIAKSLPVPAIKSQIVSMSGKVAVVAPQSAVARLVHGEIKGGEAKHDFIISVIRAAIFEAFKGNSRDIPEATKLASGKSVKARAFHAGFHCIADMIERVPYTGKFDSADNADVRTMVNDRTDSTALAFERAYLDVFATAKAEALDKREAKKAETKTAIATKVAEETATDEAPAVATAPTFELDLATTVDAIVDAIRAGLLNESEMVLIRAALATADASTEAPALAIA